MSSWHSYREQYNERLSRHEPSLMLLVAAAGEKPHSCRLIGYPPEANLVNFLLEMGLYVVHHRSYVYMNDWCSTLTLETGRLKTGSVLYIFFALQNICFDDAIPYSFCQNLLLSDRHWCDHLAHAIFRAIAIRRKIIIPISSKSVLADSTRTNSKQPSSILSTT